MTLVFPVSPLIKSPDHLPDPEALLAFDLSQKKHEIFEGARLRIKAKAQFTKSGRKPWTQLTVPIPIISCDTSEDQDLAVIWALMKESTRYDVKENSNGDLTWQLYGSHNYFEWLGVDHTDNKPVDLFVHPVKYETGVRKTTTLTTQLKKAQRSGNFAGVARIEEQLEEEEKKQAKNDRTLSEPGGHHYHWAGYDECLVTYRKNQTKKILKELQLTVRVRSFHLGTGVPDENNGYLQGCSSSEYLDPNSTCYRLLQRIGR